jgi:uncharacterized protein (TIGR02996 family)
VKHLTALLAAVHADPDDLETRLVYGDALSEAGDPRGELIALQCHRGSAPAGERERELLASHGNTWLGWRRSYPNLAELVVDYSGVARFRRSGDGGLDDLDFDASHLGSYQRAQVDAALARIPARVLRSPQVKSST